MAENELSVTGNELIRPGGNNPPFEFPAPDSFKARAEYLKLAQHIKDLYDEAKNWADGEPIADDAIHDKATELYDDLGKARREAEELRKQLAAPYDAGKTAIQNAFNAFIGDTKTAKGLIPRAEEALGALLTTYRVARQKRLDDLAAETARKAEEKTREAEAAIRASAGNLEKREEAETTLKEAKAMERGAGYAARAATTRTGLVRRYKARVTNLNMALAHYYAKGEGPHRAAFEALVLGLAQAEVNKLGKDAEGLAIPGFAIEQEATAR